MSVQVTAIVQYARLHQGREGRLVMTFLNAKGETGEVQVEMPRLEFMKMLGEYLETIWKKGDTK